MEPAEAAPARRVRAADLYPRLRTHYDEPDLDVPFQPICGEFVQWVCRTADGGSLGMSTYRLHTQARRGGGAGVSVPLRLVDAVETRDLTHLVVYCKDGRTIKVRLGSGEACAEWARRLCAASAPASGLHDTFAAAYAAWARELPPASAPRALLDPHHPHIDHNYWFKKEVQRLGFLSRNAWRVSTANAEYKLCASYPPLLLVPASIGDEDLDSVARFRAARRLPTVVWRHRGNGAVLARSSQPEVGWLGWRSSEDERLLAALVSACALDSELQPTGAHKPARLLIVDARSYTSAVTNRARGGGCECAQYYPLADIQFMNLPNIHHVRKSFHLLRQLAAEPPDSPNWHGALERSLWLQHVSGLGCAAARAARALLDGQPVLVHCSDGWDRTPQIVCAAQLLLDPYYRTVEGFRLLVQREWLHFGHKFGERCGHGFGAEEPNERSPIFLQFLDLVHQMQLQFPCHFEFNEAYLIKLVTHAHSCLFGTFLCNSLRERVEQRVHETTAHVWKMLQRAAYRNHLYTPDHHQQVLWLNYSVRSLSFWMGLYCGEWRTEPDDEDVAHEATHIDAHDTTPNGASGMGAATGGGMSKTRSCDNLMKETENRPTQRRCSDPNIAPELLNDLTRASAISSDSSIGDERLRPPTPDNLENGDSQAGDDVDGASPVLNGVGSLHVVSDTFSIEDEIAVGVTCAVGDNGDLSDEPQESLRDTRTRSPLITSNSSSLERELAATAPAHLSRPRHESVESSRTRHISIGWRSVSESSQHTDATDSSDVRLDRGDDSPGCRSDDDSDPETSQAPACASQHTLCPNSPAARHCRRYPRANNTGVHSDGAGESCETEACCCGPGTTRGGAGARCVCGAGAGVGLPARDPIDGLAVHTTPVQDTLHHIILQHKLEVAQLAEQVRTLRRRLSHAQSDAASSKTQSEGTSSCETEGEPEEVEVGQEACDAPRGVVWMPDSAAPRCQLCRKQFWLARRRHHCRKCGGVFCGFCSRERDRVRVCSNCRR